MNIYSLLVVVLLAVGGYLIVLEKKPALPTSTVKEQPAVQEIVKSESLPAVEPMPEAAPVEGESALPPSWFTARRISVMNETGVTSVPAGVEVTKISDTEIVHQGKRFSVKPGDLTNDVMVVAEILNRQDVAEERMQAQRQADAAIQQANVASVTAYDEAKKAEQLGQIDATIVSIDRQINALNNKISAERHAEALARMQGRSSSRGVTITKCEQAIAKLEAERLRLSQMR